MQTLALRQLQTAAVIGAAAVILGAFGAHGLKPQLDVYQMSIYEKAVHYQFYHTLALGLTGLLGLHLGENNKLRWAGRLFTIGIIFFSGSLYLLATRNLLPFPVGWAGPVTPLGGLSFVAGWVMLFLGLRNKV